MRYTILCSRENSTESAMSVQVKDGHSLVSNRGGWSAMVCSADRCSTPTGVDRFGGLCPASLEDVADQRLPPPWATQTQSLWTPAPHRRPRKFTSTKSTAPRWCGEGGQQWPPLPDLFAVLDCAEQSVRRDGSGAVETKTLVWAVNFIDTSVRTGNQRFERITVSGTGRHFDCLLSG